MEFDRIIIRQTDSDKIRGAELAIQNGRKTWCYKRIFREIKGRMNQQRFNNEFDFLQVDRQEQRYIDDFQREFNENPIETLERQFTAHHENVRR